MRRRSPHTPTHRSGDGGPHAEPLRRATVARSAARPPPTASRRPREPPRPHPRPHTIQVGSSRQHHRHRLGPKVGNGYVDAVGEAELGPASCECGHIDFFCHFDVYSTVPSAWRSLLAVSQDQKCISLKFELKKAIYSILAERFSLHKVGRSLNLYCLLRPATEHRA